MSKNNLRGITLGRGPIGEIHSLTLIISCHVFKSCATALKRVFLQNLSYEITEFDLLENEPVGGTHFHMNGFAQRLVLIHGQKATR